MSTPPAAGCAASAIVLPVAAAEPLVSGWRSRHDPSAAAGVPAHVTVLSPFLAPERITDAVIAELRDLFAARPAPRVWFRRTARFARAGGRAGAAGAHGVLYLAPEPPEGLRALTETVVARWPEAPPYAGLHDTIVPHLTVAIADEATLGAIEHELGAALGGGFPATLDRAVVYAHAGERWQALAPLPLGVA